MKKSMRTMAGVFAVIFAATCLLAGCGKSSEEEVATGGEAQGAESLSILLSHANAKYAMQVKENDPYVKELSRLSGTNIKTEFLGHSNDYVQQLTVRFASGDLADMIRTDSIVSTIHPGAVDQGIFEDLTPLIEEYGPNLKKNIPAEAWKSPKVSKDGKIFGIPALSALPSGRVVYIRQDWLDKLGMQQPKTLDDYLNYFEAVKKEDMNGNGDPDDEYGFYVRENLTYSTMFFREFGVDPNNWYLKDGTLEPGMIQPEIKDALKFWKNLYDKGYINPNLFTNKSADWEAGIKQGKAGAWQHDVTNFNTNWGRPDFYANEKNVKISMIESPQGPKGKGISAEGDQISFVWVMPARNKHAVEAIKFLNWAWSDDADDFFAMGIKDQNYTIVDNKAQWDADAPENKDNDASVFYQLSINPRGDGRMMDRVLEVAPNSEILKAGIQTAANNVVKNDALHMPTLESMKTKPELVPGTNAGTLFLDMFAKVITGKEEIDPAFDKFVNEWTRRGGNEMIQEATAWYNEFHQQ